MVADVGDHAGRQGLRAALRRGGDPAQGGETVATVGPGAVIGEVGILEKRLRTAAVVSQSELEVVHFTQEDLVKLVDEIPALRDALQSTADDDLPED